MAILAEELTFLTCKKFDLKTRAPWTISRNSCVAKQPCIPILEFLLVTQEPSKTTNKQVHPTKNRCNYWKRSSSLIKLLSEIKGCRIIHCYFNIKAMSKLNEQCPNIQVCCSTTVRPKCMSFTLFLLKAWLASQSLSSSDAWKQTHQFKARMQKIDTAKNKNE